MVAIVATAVALPRFSRAETGISAVERFSLHCESLEPSTARQPASPVTLIESAFRRRCVPRRTWSVRLQSRHVAAIDSSENPVALELNVMNQPLYHLIEPVLRGLRAYHRHDVRGLEHVPRRGPALILFNHSLATYDALLLAHAIHRATGRFVRGLGDRLMFRLPILRRLARELGIVEGTRANASALLEAGELVLVSPGGMREALRPSSEAFRIDWSGRTGYARVAARTGSPIILAACPMADRIYDVYPCALTRWAYEWLRVPVPVARGLGPSVLPRAVRLRHTLSAPIAPPRRDDPASIARYHARMVQRMDALLRPRRGDRVDEAHTSDTFGPNAHCHGYT